MNTDTESRKLSAEGTRIAGYCAAIAGASLATSADAAVVELSFNPGSVPFQSTFENIAVLDGTSPVGAFGQFNDDIGKSFFGTGAATNGVSQIYGFLSAASGSPITTGQAFQGYVLVGASAYGTATFGFRTASNQVGWIRIDFGGTEGAIQYLAGALNTVPGSSIVAGSFEHEVPSDVPLPASLPLAALGTLALGAVGLRRKRARAQADA